MDTDRHVTELTRTGITTLRDDRAMHRRARNALRGRAVALMEKLGPLYIRFREIDGVVEADVILGQYDGELGDRIGDDGRYLLRLGALHEIGGLDYSIEFRVTVDDAGVEVPTAIPIFFFDPEIDRSVFRQQGER